MGQWSKVSGQRELVRVSDKRSVVKGHDQGSQSGSLVRVTGQRSRVTGQGSLARGHWSGMTGQGSLIRVSGQSHWSKVQWFGGPG